MALTVGKLVALFTGDAGDYFATSAKVRKDGDELDRKKVVPKIDGDASPLDRALTRARSNLDAFAAKSPVATIDADITKAQARIRELERRRGEVGVDVDPDIAAAEAEIEALVARRRNLTIGVDPDIGGAFAAGAAMGAAAKAGIISAGVAGALGVGGGLLAATGPALLGVGTAAGISAGLISSLSKAVKAHTADARADEAASASNAASAMANGIAIRNAEQVVSDARRRAGEAAADAARQVEDAERSTARAEQDAERATRAVTAARADAARQLQDLTDRAAGYKLSVADATLSVEEAKKAQEEAAARYGEGSLEQRRAALDVEQAEARLQQTRKDGAKAVNELATAMAKDVGGSDQVVAAKQAEQDANDRVADARRAEQRVREQADRSARDSAEQVARAVQQLADTQTQQATSAGAAAAKSNTYAAELAKLTPEGRRFVETLLGMKDWAERLGSTMQTATLPGFTKLIDAGKDLEPVLAHGITVVGGAMSNTAAKGAALAKSPAFQANLWQAFDSAVPVLDAIGDSTVNLTGNWVEFMAKSGPAARGLSSLIRDVSDGVGDMFDNSTAGMSSYERILNSVGVMARDTLGELGTLMANVSNGSAPGIERLEQIWRNFLHTVDEFATTYVPGLIGGFATVLDVATKMLTPIAGLVGSIAGPVVPVIAALKLIDKVTFGGVTGQIDNIKVAMADADTKRGKFGAAMAGMRDAVFNPWAIGLGVAMTALAIWGNMQQRANELTKQAADGVTAYRSELASTGGVLSDNTRALAQKNLSSMDAYNTDKKLVDVAREHGISLADLTAAYEGNKQKQQEISVALGNQKTAWWDVAGGIGDTVQQVGFWIGASDEGGDSAADLQGQLNGLWNEVNKVGDGTKTLSYEQNIAKSAANALQVDIKKMADSTGDAASRGDALIDFLQRLSGQSPTYEDAIQRINNQMRDLADLFGANIDKSKGFGDQLLNAAGGIDTTTANGSRLRDIMQSIAQNTAGAAQAAYDLAIAQGKSVPEAMAAASAVVSDQDSRLQALATSMGLSRDQMQTLLDKYAITPEQVMSVIGQPGIENAITQADNYKRNFLDRIDPQKNTTFSVNTQPAYDAITGWYRWYLDFITKPLPTPKYDPGAPPLIFGDSGAPRRAAGGPVTAGTKYIVGEEGEEFFVPKTDGTIVPAGPTAAYQAGMAAASPAPQMAAIGGARPVRGGDGAASSPTSSTVQVEIGQQMSAALNEIRQLAMAVSNRPVTLVADGREIATAAERGATKNTRR